MLALAGGAISWRLFDSSLGCSERGETGVCGKNLCGFFPRDLNQSRRRGQFARQTGAGYGKRTRTIIYIIIVLQHVYFCMCKFVCNFPSKNGLPCLRLLQTLTSSYVDIRSSAYWWRHAPCAPLRICPAPQEQA